MTTATTTTADTANTTVEAPVPPAQLQKPEPGRINTLTRAEEVKLKLMWSYLLVEQGIAPESLCEDAREASQKLAKTTTNTSSGSDKKKSGGGLFGFGRKKSDAAAAEEVAEASITAARKKYREAVKNYDATALNRALFQMYRADHPDNLVLRFLRARKWDVAEAMCMLGETVAWRLEFDVESLTYKGEEGVKKDGEDGLMLQFRSKKCYTYGHDKKARPIVHVRPRFHDPKAQSEEDVQKFTVFTIENARLCLQDPVDTAAVIFDLSDFALSNMDYSAVKFIIKCFENHYPESLGFILIHKAPWIFQGIWNIIKNWIDPVVAAKISFTKNFEDMNQFIEAKYIPKELGGKREYEYEYKEPVEGENELQQDEETRKKLDDQRVDIGNRFQQAVIDWIQSPDLEASDKMQAEKNRLAEEFKDNYWKYDPYGRARGILDRTNQIKYFQGF